MGQSPAFGGWAVVILRKSEKNARLTELLKDRIQVMDPIKRYFEKRYQHRKLSWLTPFFGLRTDERRNALKRWFPNCDGLEILDVGCGDGTLIESLINESALRVRVEDIAISGLKEASSRLIGKSEIVESIVSDAHRPGDRSKYDLVLAIGVFDYSNDWPELLRSLLGRTRSVLIVDFPKAINFHTFLRHLWLQVNGIRLQAITRRQLDSLFEAVGVNAETIELSYNWMSKLSRE